MGERHPDLAGDERGENRRDDDSRRIINAAYEELQRLQGQRHQLTARIETIKKILRGLAEIFGGDVLNGEICLLLGRPQAPRKPGLTAAFRSVLVEARRPLTVKDLCDRLSQEHPALLEHHRDPVVLIRTILARLVHYGEVRTSNKRGLRTWASTTDSEAEAGTPSPSIETSR